MNHCNDFLHENIIGGESIGRVIGYGPQDAQDMDLDSLHVVNLVFELLPELLSFPRDAE